ncbi:MAG: hypothetical protein NC392_15265 [Roseburia sp.]|nr:hypothetical protein [Roseburia sp.]
MNANILCEQEEQTLLTDFFEKLSGLLQDSDDLEEKEKIKKAMQRMTDTTAYIVLGEEQTGKTSLLNAVFSDIFQAKDAIGGDICEYRWGEQDYETPVIDGIQKRFLSSERMKGLSVLDTKGIGRMSPEALDQIRERAARCSAVFVVLEAGNVRSPRIWDIIESIPDQKMIFFLTKCDLVTQETLDAGIEKAKSYMKDAGIAAPLFAISAMETVQLSGIAELESVRAYLRQQVIGENPVFKKQQDNIQEMRAMLFELQRSFDRRQKQYESDVRILEKINNSLDTFIVNHKQVIEKFTEKLANEIHKDIDNYETEIISKMDPYKIKERFQTKEDFMAYLDMVNSNYKDMMNDSVNRKTVETMKSCLRDLEIVFQEAIGYFNERENILDLKDRFYGTMSQSRRQISAETKETALMAGEFYMTLSSASEELFLAVWEEREKYDKKINMREYLAQLAGGTIGTVGGTVGGVAIGIKAGIMGLLIGGMATIGLIGIGVIVSTAVINNVAKTLYDSKAAAQMEESTQKCIQQFREEVGRTRENMILEVTEQIRGVFEKELACVDDCFTDFRLSVNIEGERLPELRQQMQQVGQLAEQIGRIGGGN